MNRFTIYIGICLAFLMTASCKHREDLDPIPDVEREVEMTDTRIRFIYEGCNSMSAPTKGEVVDSLSGFYVTAFMSQQLSAPYRGLMYMEHVLVEDDGQGVFDTGYYWPQVPMNFFATNIESETGNVITRSSASYEDELYTSLYDWDDVWLSGPNITGSYLGVSPPADESVYDICTGVFNYYLPAPTNEYRDAEAQPDYVFAISPCQTYDGGDVPLKFEHCFAAVNFQFALGDKDNVDKITLNNIPTIGTCEFGVESYENNNGFDLYFNWTTDTSSNLMTYNQTNRLVDYNYDITDAVFMLLPHTLASSGASFTITYQRLMDDKATYETRTATASFSNFNETWDAGKRYVYTIDLDTNDEGAENLTSSWSVDLY